MKKWIKYASVCILVLALAFVHFDIYHLIFQKGYVPLNGFVQTEETAIRIAEAVWLEIYGESIYTKQPFIAKYNFIAGYWEVEGSLPINMVGGVPYAHIRKKDGKILYVVHTR